MRSALAPLTPFAFLVLAAATGCRFGESTFQSSDPSVATFDPSGTAFAYLDAHDDELVVDENPRVVAVLTWIIFDPTGDLNDLEGSDLEDYSHELKLRDAIAFVFDAQGDVVPGFTPISVVRGGVEADGEDLLTRVHLAPERLNAQSSHADLQPLASERETTVTVTSAVLSGDADLHLAADVTIAFKRREDDPGNARVVNFVGSFRAPLVSERTAEQNLALLNVSDVLGVPLPPRADGAQP